MDGLLGYLRKQAMPVSKVISGISQPLSPVFLAVQYSLGTDINRGPASGTGIRPGWLSGHGKRFAAHVGMHLPYLDIPERLCLH